MEVDWAYQHNATDIHSKSSHALDPRRKLEEGAPKRDLEKVRGARDEGSRWSWGQVAKLAADRPCWRSSVSALCASTHEEDQVSKFANIMFCYVLIGLSVFWSRCPHY